MAKITINAIGKLQNSAPEHLIIQDYLKRLPGKLIINSIDAKEKFPTDKQKAYEGELLLKAIPQNSFIIALEEKGKEFDSISFARYLEKIEQPICFIIGGAGGLSNEVRNRADLILSLGLLTMPHMLARVVLVEQIYRTHTILSNHPYHK